MLFALCLPAEAQQTEENPSDRLPGCSTASDSAVRLEAFRQGLEQLGDEGKNITIEYRFAEGNNERFLILRETWFVLKSI